MASDRVVAFGKKKANLSCFLCNQKGANYVVTRRTGEAGYEVGVFMCQFCGALARDKGFRSQGTGATNFKEDEADFIEVRRVEWSCGIVPGGTVIM
jgi:hypothetical protein